MKKLYFTVLFIAFLGQITAQGKVERISFSLNKQSNVCIRARVNTADSLVLMFHSASTGVTLLKNVVGKKVTLNLDKKSNVESWGGKTTTDYSEGNTFGIGKFNWDSITVFTNENSGDSTDGKFGHDFFKDKVLEIDYDKKELLVHRKLPKKVEKYTKMPLIIKRGTIYIVGSLAGKDWIYQDTFMFHTGYGGSILLDPEIGERYQMQSQLTTISTSELRDSYNNVIKIETKQLPKITLAGQSLADVPLSFAAQSSTIPMKVLGNDLLKRFNVIFDFPKNEVYFQLNSLEKNSIFSKKDVKKDKITEGVVSSRGSTPSVIFRKIALFSRLIIGYFGNRLLYKS
jgi:hypothetical protein